MGRDVEFVDYFVLRVVDGEVVITHGYYYCPRGSGVDIVDGVDDGIDVALFIAMLDVDVDDVVLLLVVVK